MTAKRAYNETSLSIIDSAIAVMAETGLRNLTTKLVSQKADVSTASIHYFFDTKERLIQESFAIVMDRMWEELAAVEVNHDDPHQAIQDLLHVFYIDAQVNDRTLKIWPEIWLHASTDKGTGELFKNYNNKVIELFTSLLVSAGLKPKVARLYAFRLNTLHRGLWIELNVGGSMNAEDARDVINATMITIRKEIKGELG